VSRPWEDARIVQDMVSKEAVRDYLMSRRANLTPEDAGLPRYHDDRRVPGLRREEVAMLAGVSVDYYTKLERGNLQGASADVLDAIARALQLDDVERRHLFNLASVAPTSATRSGEPVASRVPASIQHVLDSMTIPAIAYDASHHVVASNVSGRALFAWMLEADRPNLARFIFLDSRAPQFYGDWPLACSLTAAMLRYEAGRDPLNEDITALVGELSTRSPAFRTHWADRDVHEHRSGTKTYHHHHVGELELTYDVLAAPGAPGISITTFSPEPGSASADKIAMLASWAADT
jgi:transcriptional regulator with XRE-family HTH domain